jgi:hypothetical protein
MCHQDHVEKVDLQSFMKMLVGRIVSLRRFKLPIHEKRFQCERSRKRRGSRSSLNADARYGMNFIPLPVILLVHERTFNRDMRADGLGWRSNRQSQRHAC